MIVDTHAHIYSPDEKRYPPIDKPNRPPGGKGSIGDLRKESRASGVTHACAIQVTSFYRFDNRYICDTAAANPQWIAGVCTLDPDDEKSPAMLARFVKEYRIKGMRSIPAKSGALDHPGVRALWKACADAGIVVNVLVGHEKTDQVSKLLGDFPGLRVVLDHCMNLKAGAEMQPVLADVLQLARHKNLHAKLTFIPTGSSTGYPCADMHGVCMQVINGFGPERCVWGSDFPCELWTPKVKYAEHLRIFQHDLPLKQAARDAILSGTAKRLWFS